MKKYSLLLLFFVLVTSIGCAQSKRVKSVSVAEAKEVLMDTSVCVLDVRTANEVKLGKLDNAVVMNFYSSSFDNDLLTLDKEKAVFVYCKGGGRSMSTAKKLKQLGFKTVYNLKGGYDAWKNE